MTCARFWPNLNWTLVNDAPDRGESLIDVSISQRINLKPGDQPTGTGEIFRGAPKGTMSLDNVIATPLGLEQEASTTIITPQNRDKCRSSRTGALGTTITSQERRIYGLRPRWHLDALSATGR